MKASPSLLAVLLTLSSTSLAQTATSPQTAPVQETAPTQQTAPVQETAPTQQTAPAQQAAPTQQTAPVQETAPTQLKAPVQETAPTQQADPTQQVAGGESAKPEAASPETEGQASTPSPAPTASTPSTDAAAASVSAVLAAPSAPVFAPGAKLFIAPMNGFEQFLSDALVKKKVPVVVVTERANADFVVTGGARVKKRGFFTGMVLNDHGGGDISINDARTGKPVFACTFNRVDQGLAEGYIYEGWANNCAKHLKKLLEKK